MSVNGTVARGQFTYKQTPISDINRTLIKKFKRNNFSLGLIVLENLSLGSLEGVLYREHKAYIMIVHISNISVHGCQLFTIICFAQYII